MIVSRARVGKEDWNRFVDEHHVGWWWHRAEWIDYSVAYSPNAVDYSFGVLDSGHLVGIVPLVVANEQLVMGGQITPAPLFNPMLPEYGVEAASAAERLIGRKPFPIQSRPGIVPTSPPPPGICMLDRQTYVLDLRETTDMLWRNLRKSYKSLIRKAEREYSISVHAKSWPVMMAQDLHDEMAERQTRSQATWNMMAQWAEDGHALTALAQSENNCCESYAYVIRYKHWAYYASAANRFGDVQHALQWALIGALKSGDVAAYELGSAAYDADEKAQGIAHFKAGFGAMLLPYCVVTETVS